MRTINLTATETKLIHGVMNVGDPQRGLSLSEIRTLIPLMDKIEATVTRKQVEQGEMLEFKDMTLEATESEYEMINKKLESSSGWMNVEVGRIVLKLIDKLKDIPSAPKES